MKSPVFVAVSILALSSQTALADMSFPEMVSDSNGYLHIRDNVVLVETDDGSYMCRLNITDAAFDAQEQGEDIPEDAASATCIPLEEFEN
ncbi:hypothetical protein [uncultured Shimia sp.]|uniref:hypothetical protein n=1 Tax=uncultured Shimia sp. TaxID=573152 RepID=UPI0025F2E082|nr:hypothetical protein [uncultured Shimia sp.]